MNGEKGIYAKDIEESPAQRRASAVESINMNKNLDAK